MKVETRPKVGTLVVALLLLITAAVSTPAGASAAGRPRAAAATPFKVLAFYTGPAEGDAAHVSFETEARTWFPQVGSQNGFTFTATTDWDMLDGLTNGSEWDWYYNRLLGTGAFETNTWLYANFGHNDMNYTANIPTSSTFAGPEQDAFIIDGLLWLGNETPSDQSTDQVSQSTWFSVVNAGYGKCAGARAAGTTDGTAVQQSPCDGTAAQEFQFHYVDGPYLRVNNRDNATESLDVTEAIRNA